VNESGTGDQETHDRATDTDSNGQLHLALHRHPDRGDVFCSVGNEGQQDQTNERLGDTVSLGGLLDGSNN
jgi:hypothetical protein